MDKDSVLEEIKSIKINDMDLSYKYVKSKNGSELLTFTVGSSSLVIKDESDFKSLKSFLSNAESLITWKDR